MPEQEKRHRALGVVFTAFGDSIIGFLLPFRSDAVPRPYCWQTPAQCSAQGPPRSVPAACGRLSWPWAGHGGISS